MTDYLNDVQPGLPVVLAETSGANTMRYIHSLRGIHAMENSVGAWSHPLPDGLGSVRGEIDDSVFTQGSRQFAPYGKAFGENGAIDTPFAFTGEQLDGNDLQYHRARYYAPGLGVFTGLDVVEELNRYSYVGNNPVNFTDPSGMIQCLPTAFGVICDAPGGILDPGGILAPPTEAAPPTLFPPGVTPITVIPRNPTITPTSVPTIVPPSPTPFPTIITTPTGAPTPEPTAQQTPSPNPTPAPTTVGTTVSPTITATPSPAAPPIPTMVTVTDPVELATLLNGGICLAPTLEDTATQIRREAGREKPIVVDLGPGFNTMELENILLARPNAKVVAIDRQDAATFQQLTVGLRYSSERLEIIAGDFGNAQILNGRRAIEMFSIYPDSDATGSLVDSVRLKTAVALHLTQGGTFYAVTEIKSRLELIATALIPIMGFGYVRSEGVPVSVITTGQNGPGIPFTSSFNKQGTAYDLWGVKR